MLEEVRKDSGIKKRLWTISDLDVPENKDLLKYATVIERIESMLLDMNVTPFSINLDSMEIGDKVRATNVFSASEVGRSNGRSLDGEYEVGCARYLQYSYSGLNVPKNIEPRFRRIMDTGTVVHGQLQAYLAECAKRQGFEFLAERSANPSNNKRADKHNMSMHMDGECRIVLPDGAIRFGLEIKTMNDKKFRETNDVHGEHATQGTIYQYAFDLPLMLFLYYNKNDSSMAEYIQIFDRNRWLAIVKKLEKIKCHIDVNKLAEQESSADCTYCKYKLECNPPLATKAKTGMLPLFFRAKQNS